MNRRQKIIVSVTGIFIVLLILIGLTYAYFLTRITGNSNPTSISVTTANLELVYGDNSAEIIKGTGALMPTMGTDVDDAIGTKTFTVTNNGDDSSYVVIIDNVSVTKASDGSSTTFVSNDFRYTLTCSVKDKSGSAVTSESCNDVDSLSIFPIKGGILVGNDIPEDRVHEYTLTLWYIDTGIDQSDDMGKTLQARVNITDVAQMQNPFTTGVTATDNASLAYNIIKNAKENKNGTELLNVPLSKVAESISQYGSGKFNSETVSTGNLCDGYNAWLVGDTLSAAQDGDIVSSYEEAVGKYVYDQCDSWTKYLESYDSSISTLTFKIEEILDESSLSIEQDDYGTSYYYRGDVADNYVNFAGMCWKIVRIAGDGTTKLILEDQYTTCNDTETETTTAVYTGNWNIGTGNYGYDSSSKSTLGLTLYKMNYLNPVTNNTSSMVKAFYDFQTTKLADYTGKLKSGDWCLGDTAYSISYSYPYTYTLLEDTSSNYLSVTQFYYDASTRLTGVNANGYQPTLKCNGTILNEFADVSGVSSKVPMYVSAITADEIVYAGGKYGEANGNYYLINNYQKSFWSLSPADFYSSYSTLIGVTDFAFHVNNNGNLNKGNVHASDLAFRPSVSLASSAVITGGEGTLESPYVIG